MNIVKLTFLIAALGLSVGPVMAQGTAQTQSGSPQRPTNSNAGNAVSTSPSSNPFSNPIGQGVPPAASSNSARNNNRSTLPLNGR